MTEHSRVARRQATRWASTLVAITVVVTQLFALGHLVLFTHARCEHGSVIHVPGHQWRVEPRATVLAKGVFFVRSDAERDADHDHCDALTTPPSLAVLRAPHLDGALVAARMASHLGAREGSRSLSILSFAPKTSPTV